MNSQETYDALLDLLKENLEYLPDKPEENPRSTLHTLWHHCCGCPTTASCAHLSPLPRLNQDSYCRLKQLIHKRIEGIPLAYLTGRQEFMNINFIVGTRALIPRKETEILGYEALNKIKACAKSQAVVKVIDVCTGIGNLALAFAVHVDNADILAADISKDAIDLAKKNARNLSLEKKVRFFTGDLLEPFEKEELSDSVDVLTCNPPYISTQKVKQLPDEIRRNEPPEAFDGGSFGLTIIMRLIREAIPFLKHGGWLCFEVGLGQGERLCHILNRNANFQDIHRGYDEKGNVRAILAQVTKAKR
jgi:release factor glutamine methyltransferase